MTKKECLALSKCYYGAEIAIAIAGLLASAYGQYSTVKAQQKSKRNAANASQLAAQNASAGGNFAPTATKFQTGEDRGGGGAHLGEILGDSKPASDHEQGFSLGMKSLDAPEAKPQSFEGTFQADANTALPVSEVKGQPSQSSGGADTASQIGGYGQLAMQLYDLYRKNTQAPPPGQTPQLGQMNLAPTANRFGIR